jgi:O-antigen ligase
MLLAATGWTGVAWRLRPWALEDQGVWRAATTLTYANAAAGLLVPLALLALASLAAAPRSPLLSVAASALLVGVGATASRGGLVALAAGVGVLIGLLGLAPVLRATALAGLGAALALGALLPSMSAASAPRPAMAVVGLVIGLAAVSRLSLVSGRVLAMVLAALAVLAIAVITSSSLFRDAAEAISGPRVSARSSDRAKEAAAAIRLFANRPLTGVGPGGASLAWADPDGGMLVARYAHNEYLQVLVEFGAIGLALLGGLLGSIGVTVWRGRSSAPSPPVWAGVTAGLVALGIHSGFDFLWHIPVIPLTAAVLVGIVSPHYQYNPDKAQT